MAKFKIKYAFLEVLKWGLVIFLLLPLFQKHLPDPYDFPRIILGVLLLVLFVGKMFYDFMLEKPNSEQRALWLELLRMLGVVLIIAAMIAAVILFIGLYIYFTMQEKAGV